MHASIWITSFILARIFSHKLKQCMLLTQLNRNDTQFTSCTVHLWNGIKFRYWCIKLLGQHRSVKSVCRVRAPSEPLNSMIFPWLFHDKIRKFHDLLVSNLAHNKGSSRVHQNITWNITIWVWQECHFCGIFPFSITFPWLFTFLKISMTSPGLEISHSNSMTFPGFPCTHEPCVWLDSK